MVTVLIAVPEPIRRKLADISERTGIARNELVRRALAEWLARHAQRKGKGPR